MNFQRGIVFFGKFYNLGFQHIKVSLLHTQTVISKLFYRLSRQTYWELTKKHYDSSTEDIISIAHIERDKEDAKQLLKAQVMMERIHLEQKKEQAAHELATRRGLSKIM